MRVFKILILSTLALILFSANSFAAGVAVLTAVSYDNGSLSSNTDDILILTFDQTMTDAGAPGDYTISFDDQCGGTWAAADIPLPNTEYTVAIGVPDNTIIVTLTAVGLALIDTPGELDNGAVQVQVTTATGPEPDVNTTGSNDINEGAIDNADVAELDILLSAAPALAEASLDGAQITINMSGDSFVDMTLVTTNFTLNNAPPGTSVGYVVPISLTQAILGISFDGTDFDSDVNNLNVTILAAELNGGVDNTSNDLVITANPDAESITALWANPPNTNGVEATMDAEIITVTIAGGTFIPANVTTGNVSLSGTATGAGVGISLESIVNVTQTSFDIFVAWDGTDYDLGPYTLTVDVLAAAFDESDGDLSDDLPPIIATDEGPPAVTIAGALAEGTLNGATVTLALTNDLFIDGTLSTANFTLNSAPTGLTVNYVTYVDNQNAVVGFAFDGTDFDSDVTTFSINVLLAELVGGADVTSNDITINAVVDAESITAAWANPPNTTGVEATMDAEIVTVTITGGTFIPANVTTGNVSFSGTATGAGVGISLESIVNVTQTSFDIYVAWDGTDYDLGPYTLTVDVLAAAFDESDGDLSDNLVITATDEGAAAVAILGPLNEGTLDGATLNLALSNDLFINAILDPANFTLNSAPVGLTVDYVTYVDNQNAVVGFAFDGTDFDSDVTTFSINVLLAELVGGADVTSNDITINAVVDAESITAAWANPPNTNGVEATMDAEIITVTITGGTFIPANVTTGNVSFSGTATGAGVGISLESIVNVTQTSFDIFVAWDGTDYDAGPYTLTIDVLAAAFDESDGDLSDNLVITATDEGPAAVTIAGAMNEATLDGTTLNLTLTNDLFINTALDPSNFTLNSAPTGLTVDYVIYVDNQNAVVGFAFDGTDFDSDVTTFSINVLLAELVGGADVTSNDITINAVVDAESITAAWANPPNTNGVEATMDAEIITVTITGGTFIPANVTTGNVSFSGTATGAAVGISLESIVNVTQTSFDIYVAWDGTDYDLGPYTLTVDVLAAAFDESDGDLSDDLPPITATDEGAASVAIAGALAEGTLDGATVTLTLTNDLFIDDGTLVPGNFTLNSAPTGLTVDYVIYVDNQNAVVGFAFDGTDFDTDITTFSIDVLAAELVGGADVTSNDLTITATNDVESITVTWATIPGTNGFEATMNDEVVTITITNGTFITGNINGTNVTATSVPPGLTLGNFINITETSFDIEITWDGSDYDADQTLTIEVDAAAYNDPGAALSNSITCFASVEGVTISSTPSPLDETNIDGAQITIELTGGETFTGATLVVGNFTLNNAPPGLTIGSVIYIDNNSAIINLAFDYTDFDSDYNNLNVTVSNNELTGASDHTSNDLTITAIDEVISATLSAVPALTESDLNGADILITISGVQFNELDHENGVQLSEFMLNNAPSGLTVSSFVVASDRWSATLTLAFDGTDFDTDITNFSITIDENACWSASNVTTNAITISAFDDAEAITATWAVSPGTGGDEPTLNNEVITVTLTGGELIMGNVPANVSISGTAVADAGVILQSVSNVTESSFNVNLDWDGTDFDVIKDIAITLGTAAFSDNTGDVAIISNSINLVPFIETASISSIPFPILESALNGMIIVVDLTDETFSTPPALATTDFTLNNVPPGVTISSVSLQSPSQANLMLSFDGTDFDVSIPDFSVSIDETKLTSGNPLTSNDLTINAVIEGTPEVILSGNIHAQTANTENNIINGNICKIVLTIRNATWHVDVGTAANKTKDVLNSITGDGGATGWTVVTSTIITDYNDGIGLVTRVNDTVVEVLIPPIPLYDISANETLTIDVRHQALSVTANVAATENLIISAELLPYDVSVMETGSVSGSYCEGSGGLTVMLNGSEPGINYQLTKDSVLFGNPIGGTGDTISWSNSTEGYYHIIATPVGTTDSVYMNDSASIVEIAMPTANNYSPDPLCEDVIGGASTNNVDLTTNNAAIDGGMGNTINWYNDAGLTIPVAVPNATTVSNGQFFYAEVVEGICTNTATVVYLVNALPTATIAGGGTICDGDSTLINIFLTGSSPWDFTYTDGTTPVTVTGTVTNPYSGFVSPSVNSTYSVTTISNASCGNTGTGTTNVDVNPLPNPDFYIKYTHLWSGTPGAELYTITGATPYGGDFSGPGIVANDSTFDPYVSGTGTHQIEYEYTDPATGCSNTVIHTVEVIDADGSIDGAEAGYCIDDAPVVITGNNGENGVDGGTFAGPGITNVFLDAIEFTPAVAGAGTHNLTYTYTDTTGGVPNTVVITATINVHDIGAITISGLDLQYCYVDINDTISASLYPGVFSGDRITQNLIGGKAVLNPYLPDYAEDTLWYAYDTLYADGTTCARVEQRTFIVNPLPNVSIVGYKDLYNVTEPPYVLDGQYLSGNYTGPLGSIVNLGSGDARFDPGVASVAIPPYPSGPYLITYTYTDGNSCTDDTTISVMIDTARGEIIHTNDVYHIYCYDEAIDTLVAAPINSDGNPGVFTGDGINDLNDGTAEFDPALAGSGYHTISYQYFGIDGVTSFTLTQQLYVDSIQNISIAGLNDICVDADSTIINGVPQYAGGEGTFNYSGPIGGINPYSDGTAAFYPTIAGAGTHNITYTYNSTRPNSVCTKDVTLPITVNVLPNVSIVTYKDLYNVTDAPYTLVGQYNSGSYNGPYGSITQLGFGKASFDPGVDSVAIAPYPSGPYDITYTYTDGNMCTDDTTISVMTDTARGTILHTNDVYHIYCYDEVIDTLEGAPLNDDGNPGVFTGNGINDLGDGTAEFDPALAGSGYHTISYQYFGIDGITSFTLTQQLYVDLIQNISIAGLNDICVDADSTIINGVPQYAGGEGTFNYSGTIGGINPYSDGTAAFYPTIAGAGTHDITYTYNSTWPNSVCTKDVTMPITVNALPFVSIVTYKDLYNVTEAAYTLVGQYNSGTYTGPYGSLTALGSGNASFDPGADSVTIPPYPSGPYDITYTYTDGNMCTDDTTISVTIDTARGAILHTNDVYHIYCYDEVIDTISGAPLNSDGNPGVFSGDGINDLGDGTAEFDPALAGSGYHTISYQYFGVDGITSFTITQQLYVDSIQNISITGLNDICVDAASSTITGDPQYLSWEGDFTYNGTLGGVVPNINGTATFYPPIAGSGVFDITYTYNSTLPNSICAKSVTLPITVNALPNVQIVTYKELYNVEEGQYLLEGQYPYGTFELFTGGVPNPASIITIGSGDAVFYPDVAGLGSHDITYTYTDTITGCTDDTTITVTVDTASGTINGAHDDYYIYCYDENIDTLFGNPNPALWNGVPGTFFGDGIIDMGDGTAQFYPDSAGGGFHTIQYEFTADDNITTFIISQEVFVDSISQLYIHYQDMMDSVCLDYDNSGNVVTITGDPAYNLFYGGFVLDGVQPNNALIPLAGGSAWFYPDSAGVGWHDIEYTYFSTTQNSTCIRKVTDSIFVNDLPYITDHSLRGTYNVMEDSTLLTAVPSGGVFVGLGVNSANGYFHPADLNINNNYTIVYTWADPITGCMNDTVLTTTVIDVDANINGLPLGNNYCIDGALDTLEGEPLSNWNLEAGTFSINGVLYGPGLDSVDFNSVEINPALAGQGYHEIRFEYYDDMGTLLFRDITIFVDSIGPVTFVSQEQEFCNTPGTFFLQSTLNGEYSGLGVTDVNITDKVADFNPFVAGVGSPVVTFIFTNSATGCTSSADQTFLVRELPQISFVIDDLYCDNYGDVQIQGLEDGLPVDTAMTSLFSGNAVTTNSEIGGLGTFITDLAPLGATIITFDYEGQYCANVFSDTVIVAPAPDLNIIGLATDYCVDNSAITIRGNQTDGIFSGAGITDTNYSDSLALFIAADAGVGINHEIMYKYADAIGCVDSIIVETNVYDLPSVSLTGLDSLYCKSDNISTLQGFPMGGTFYYVDTIGWVSTGAEFNPASPNYLGPEELVYEYTDVNNCTSSDTMYTNVYTNPVAEFAISDLCIADEIDFNDMSTTDDPIATWDWDFGDNQVVDSLNTSALQNPNHLYPTPGFKEITLEISTMYGCTDIISSSFELSNSPNVDFTWSNECFCENPTTFVVLKDTNVTFSSYLWDFGDNSIDTTVLNTSHAFDSPDSYDVSLAIATPNGCIDTIEKTVHIRPFIKFDELPDGYYQEDFETGNAGWFQAVTPVSSWELGFPADSIINYAASGSNSWCTDLDADYPSNEKSWVVSPCFDFTTLRKPMIKMNAWWVTRDGDGAVVQYSEDDGVTWENVGSWNNGQDGIGWYNVYNLDGQPGSQTEGWSGDVMTDWTEVRHDLDMLAGLPNVKLRIAFGANEGSNSEGFAFDDIWVGERSRIVLVEQSVNSSSTECANGMPGVNNLINANGLDLVNVQYHSNFSGSDPFYSQNPADQSARLLYYGISNDFYTVMDGNQFTGYSDFWLSNPDIVKLRSLRDPLFNLALTTSKTASDLSISVDIEAIDNIVQDQLSLHVIVVEKKITSVTGANGETVFQNVLKKMLPNAGGTPYDQTWSIGDTETFSTSWTFSDVYNTDELKVVAFIQDETTKEVYQAATDDTTVSTTIDEYISQMSANDFEIFPNPTSGQFQFIMNNEMNALIKIEILNSIGQIIQSTESNISGPVHMDASQFESGVYFVRVAKDNMHIGVKRIIITD